MQCLPLMIDLFCGLGGWAEGGLSEGYRVIGFDIEARPYPGQLVLQDVTTLHGRQFKDATVIVGRRHARLTHIERCRGNGLKHYRRQTIYYLTHAFGFSGKHRKWRVTISRWLLKMSGGRRSGWARPRGIMGAITCGAMFQC